MSHLASILSWVTTISTQRKNELIERHTTGTLTEEDRVELSRHLVHLLSQVQRDRRAAEKFLQATAES